MNTQLIIMSSGVTTTYASSGTVDLYDNVPVSLNYSIADIKEPQKRNSDYSKTVTVPGSNNNNNLLSHIYEIGIDRLFNPNHRTEARVLYDGVQVFKGYMRLAKIRKLKDEKIEYDLELRGRLDDLFTNLLDKRLTDLNWTDLDHNYSRGNIINSWSAPVGSNYVYPFIDYGYSTKPDTFDTNHFFPAVYIKEAVDRAFSYAGFQYSSTFLTSTFFKSLILPFTGENMRLTAAQIVAREFKAARSTTHQTHVPFQTSGTYNYFNNVFNDDNSTGNTDGGNNYNTSTGIYTVPANGYYYFTANISVDGLATPHLANQYLNYYIYGVPRLIVNGVAKVYGQFFSLTFGTGQYSTAQASTNNPAITNSYVTYSAFFQAGDTVYIDFQALLNANPDPALSGKPIGNVDYQIRLNTGAYFYAKPEPIIKQGDTVTFANTLPQDMKIMDFLVSIIKMFNLYFEYDKDVPNKIHIEPRNDYYNSTVQDWSTKLDASKEPEIIPMGALNAKRYRFTYKQDGDVLNKTYQTTYGETYGEKHVDVDNDFVKNTDTMEVLFSPTPQYGILNTQRFYPALYNVDSNMNIVHNKSMNPRILYYGGLKTCATWYLTTTLGSVITKTGTLNTYPYCGMLDDPNDPTQSLDFSAPKEVYYTPSWQGAYTNNNLYNKYWKQFIDEITDYNSSIVTAWFWLKPADIMEVDFRHVYRFLNQNFRLNKIYDYNPSAKSLTKCEFIKIKQGIPFVAKSKVIKGFVDPFDPALVSERVPAPPNNNNTGTNSPPTLGYINQVYGEGNYVSPTATGIVINGNTNSVGTDSNNVSIMNSSGCIVAGGLVNVSIMNSSGVTVTESNTVVENGVTIFSPSQGSQGYWYKRGNVMYNGNTGYEVRTNHLTLGNNTGTNPSDDRVKINWSSGTEAFIRGVQNVPMKLQAFEGAGEVAVTGDGRFYGLALHNNSGAVTGTANQYVASGTYTPTIANNVNLDSNPTALTAQWIRVGNVVTVSGGIDNIDQTAGATLTSFTATLPIASDLTVVENVSGVGTANTLNVAINISADVTANIAYFVFLSSGTGVLEINYTYTYLIQ